MLVWRGIVFWHAGIIYNAFGVGYRCNCIWAAGKRCGFYSGENPRQLTMRPTLLLCTAGLSSAAPASDATVRLRPPTLKIKAVGRAGPSDRRGTNACGTSRYRSRVAAVFGSVWLSWLRYHASAAGVSSTVCAATADGHGSGVPRKTSRTTIGLHGWPRVARKHLWLGLRSILRIYCRAEVVVPHPWRRSSDPRSALSFSSEAETQMLHLHLLHVSQAGHLLQHYVLGGPFF